MREILEDAALIYRQELDSLFALLIAAVVVGPVLLIISTTGMQPALAVAPLLLMLYLGTYASCLYWAGHQLGIRPSAPMPTGAFLLRRSVDIALAAAQPALLLLGATASGLLLADRGQGYMSLLFGAAAAVLTARWAYRHVYDLPLVVAYEASAREAMQASHRLDDASRRDALRLFGVAGAPMILVALVSLWLSLAVAPVVGATLFLLAGTAWMPFAALCLTGGCERALRQSERAARRTVERVVASVTPARR